MSLEQIESKILALPQEERRAFAEWFYDHESEIIEGSEPDELSDEWKRELKRRRDEMIADPSMAIPVTAEYFERLRKKLADARAANASTR